MKKFALTVMATLTIVMCGILPLKAQSDYGSDIIVNNLPSENQTNPSLTIADNGWLFAGFSIGGGYTVYKSIDNGLTWSIFCSFTSATRTYDKIKVLVCGDTPFKVFIACLYHESASSYTIYIDTYDGTTGTYLNEPVDYTFNTDIYDFDIATDDYFPSGMSSPYSVGLLYSVHSSSDSVTFVLSTDGGVSFAPKKSVATTGQWFGKVSLAYGRSWNYSNGRYFAVWEHKTAYQAPVGHIEFARTTTYVNSSFTTPVFLDNSSNGFLNRCRNPKIACQYNNTDNDSSNVTAAVIFERYYSHLDNDIVGVYNKRAASGTTWNTFFVDNSGSRNTKQPDLNYDCDYNNFLVTYWDSTNTLLPYVIMDYNMTSPYAWTVISTNYNNNTTMGSFSQPYPVVEINHNLHMVAHLWSQVGTSSNGVVLFDAEYSTVGINETINYGNNKINNIYPNPAYNKANIEIELSKPDLVQINIYDMSGKKLSNVYNAQTSEGKNTISFDVSSFANGDYIIEMLSDDTRITKKMMVTHQ